MKNVKCLSLSLAFVFALSLSSCNFSAKSNAATTSTEVAENMAQNDGCCKKQKAKCEKKAEKDCKVKCEKAKAECEKAKAECTKAAKKECAEKE